MSTSPSRRATTRYPPGSGKIRSQRAGMVQKKQEKHMSQPTKAADRARELHEHRHDPDEWSEEAETIRPRAARTAVVSFRLPLEEFAALEISAGTAGGDSSRYTSTTTKKEVDR